MDDARLFGGAVHLLHFAGVQSERLFAHDVLASPSGGDRDLFVREVGGGYQHTVDVVGGTNFAIVSRDAFESPVSAALVEQLGIGVAGGHELGSRIEADARHMMVIADGAGTDDGQSNRLGRVVHSWMLWRKLIKAVTKRKAYDPARNYTRRRSANAHFTAATRNLTAAARCTEILAIFFLAFYDNGHTIPFMTLVVSGAAMNKNRKLPRLSAGEMEIVQMLWRAGAVTLSEAHAALERPIGYTTVQTRLNRLVEKGGHQPHLRSPGALCGGGGAGRRQCPAFGPAVGAGQRRQRGAAGRPPGARPTVIGRRNRRAQATHRHRRAERPTPGGTRRPRELSHAQARGQIMTPTTNDLLLNLGRTTLTLTIAVLLIGILLRLARVTAPSVHRYGCVLALAVGWSLLQWPVHVPWYEPANVGQNDASAEMAADDASESTLSTPPAGEGDALATIELPHEDLDAPLDDGPRDNASDADSQVASTLIIDSQGDENYSQMADGSSPMPDGVASSLPLFAEEAVPATEATTFWQALPLAAVAPYLLVLWCTGIVVLVITWLAGYVRFVSRLPAARDADEDWTDQWQALLVDFGIRNAVPLRVTGETGPMLCRLPRGYELLIPGPLWHELSPPERGAILRHELAHLARGDVWKFAGGARAGAAALVQSFRLVGRAPIRRSGRMGLRSCGLG